MKRTRCGIDKCNGYIRYTHLHLCKPHYNYLSGTLGWRAPSRYMDSEAAKRIIENSYTYSNK